MSAQIPPEDRQRLLAHARRCIRAALAGEPLPEMADPPQALRATKGCFVTLRMRPADTLRGCLGRIEPQDPLWRIAGEVAAASATRDRRFAPLTPAELDAVRIQISVLEPFERIHGPADIVVGEHGVYLTCGAAEGLLLPQVAAEYGWDAQEFVRRVCGKAGVEPEAWHRPEARLYRFRAEVFGEED